MTTNSDSILKLISKLNFMKKANRIDSIRTISHGVLATTSHGLLTSKPRPAFAFTEES